jgi:hypothetical protein
MLMLNIVQIHQTDLEKNDQNVANRNLRIFENQLVITGHGIHTPFMANKMNHLAIRPGVVHKKMVTFLWHAPVYALSHISQKPWWM